MFLNLTDKFFYCYVFPTTFVELFVFHLFQRLLLWPHCLESATSWTSIWRAPPCSYSLSIHDNDISGLHGLLGARCGKAFLLYTPAWRWQAARQVRLIFLRQLVCRHSKSMTGDKYTFTAGMQPPVTLASHILLGSSAWKYLFIIWGLLDWFLQGRNGTSWLLRRLSLARFPMDLSFDVLISTCAPFSPIICAYCTILYIPAHHQLFTFLQSSKQQA